MSKPGRKAERLYWSAGQLKQPAPPVCRRTVCRRMEPKPMAAKLTGGHPGRQAASQQSTSRSSAAPSASTGAPVPAPSVCLSRCRNRSHSAEEDYSQSVSQSGACLSRGSVASSSACVLLQRGGGVWNQSIIIDQLIRTTTTLLNGGGVTFGSLPTKILRRVTFTGRLAPGYVAYSRRV